MDTDIIEQFSGDLGCFRMRTTRQKKRLRYKDLDKQLRTIDRERAEIWKAQRNLGWEPLEPPVQRGWKRFFVLREDVARSIHTDFFECVLNKINTFDWSYRKDFLVRKSRHGKNKFGVKVQRLKRLYDFTWNRIGFSDEEKEMFHVALEQQPNGKLIKRYEFSEPWRFVLRIRPNIIDKTRIRDADLESRKKIIETYLERKNRNHRLTNLKGGYRYLKWRTEEKAKEKNPLANKPLYQILEEAKEDYWEYDF
jgi:hypothetical protein